MNSATDQEIWLKESLIPTKSDLRQLNPGNQIMRMQTTKLYAQLDRVKDMNSFANQAAGCFNDLRYPSW